MKLSNKLIILFIFCSEMLFAQWSQNSLVNTTITNVIGDQQSSDIISDGAGGAIITWTDTRFGNQLIYCQKINMNGVSQWTPSGVCVETAPTGTTVESNPRLLSDGSGGAFIVYSRTLTTGQDDLYMMHIYSTGSLTGPYTICTAANQQLNPKIISDGSAGAIISWYDLRTSPGKIYAQRVNSSGDHLWNTNGVLISNLTAQMSEVSLPDQGFDMVSDGSGGCIITFEYNSTNADIYAQKIASDSTKPWGASGVIICNSANIQQYPHIITDGINGAIITWTDYRASPDYPDIYAQRINSSGLVLWISQGVVVCNDPDVQKYSELVQDGSGGAIIGWLDFRFAGAGPGYYAQEINSNGSPQWIANGVWVSRKINFSVNDFKMLKSPTNNIIFAMLYGGGGEGIYTQCINSSGIIQWTGDITACSVNSNPNNVIVTTDGSGGEIISWADQRYGNYDVFAQRVQSDGILPVTLAYFNSETFDNSVRLRWETTTELNNMGYNIERKKPDGNEWIAVGFIPGHGTTNEPKDYAYDDRQLETGQYQYRLKQNDYNGNSQYFILQQLAVVGSPVETRLMQNFPNPFNPVTKINFTLPFDAWVSLKVYDIRGSEIAVLVNEIKKSGYYYCEFNGSNIASGIYFYRLIAKGLDKEIVQTKKMNMIK